MKWRLAIVAGLIFCLWGEAAQGGVAFYGLGTKIGLDVVQNNDTRRFYILQADIASLFNSNLLLEVAGEFGSGNDTGGDEIQVTGGNLFVKYLWPNRFRTAYAFMGAGVGVTRIRRTTLDVFAYTTQSVLHLTFIGMEKHAFGGRMKGIFEVRWVMGDRKDSSSLRAAVGIGVNLKKP